MAGAKIAAICLFVLTIALAIEGGISLKSRRKHHQKNKVFCSESSESNNWQDDWCKEYRHYKKNPDAVTCNRYYSLENGVLRVRRCPFLYNFDPISLSCRWQSLVDCSAGAPQDPTTRPNLPTPLNINFTSAAPESTVTLIPYYTSIPSSIPEGTQSTATKYITAAPTQFTDSTAIPTSATVEAQSSGTNNTIFPPLTTEGTETTLISFTTEASSEFSEPTVVSFIGSEETLSTSGTLATEAISETPAATSSPTVEASAISTEAPVQLTVISTTSS